MVSVLGCGWLGLPLAAELVKRGYSVKGSVRSNLKFPALIKAGIQPYVLELLPEISGSNTAGFFSCDTLIVNFPPERRPDIEQFLAAQLEALLTEVIENKIGHVLFISSTSVYPDVNRIVMEDDRLQPEKGSGKALVLAEAMLLERSEFTTTVVRFGGLVGPDRLPGRFLAGKKNIPNGDAPVNMIHQQDCIEIICQIIKQQVWGEVFNAAADEHPLRKDYYSAAALQAGLDLPEFAIETETSFKVISSEKLKSRLGYSFMHPDPSLMF